MGQGEEGYLQLVDLFAVCFLKELTQLGAELSNELLGLRNVRNLYGECRPRDLAPRNGHLADGGLRLRQNLLVKPLEALVGHVGRGVDLTESLRQPAVRQ